MTAMGAMATVWESLNNQLTLDGSRDDLCAMTIYPGSAVPIDYAGLEDCGGGMAWVRLVSAVPTVSFPNADTIATSCAYTVAYQLEIAIMRPAPLDPETFGQDVDLPSDTDHFEATRRQMDDMHLMLRAIEGARDGVTDLIIGQYSPLGPQGGAVGGMWGLTVGDED